MQKYIKSAAYTFFTFTFTIKQQQQQQKYQKQKENDALLQLLVAATTDIYYLRIERWFSEMFVRNSRLA